MLIVVFGAGASHGSSALRLDARPPLTSELFAIQHSEIADRYPASRPAIMRLRHAMSGPDPKRPIEAEIARLFEEAEYSPERARHLLGLRFYLNDLVESITSKWWQQLDGFSFYGQLLERLGSWRSANQEAIALVTFNYDELLDLSAIAQAGDWSLADFPSYVKRPDWRLYKLHGSTTWSRVLRRQVAYDPSEANSVISDGARLNFEEGELVPVRWSGALNGREVVAAPGIAVPTNVKQTFSCPAEHQTLSRKDIERATRLIIIGWRAPEPPHRSSPG